MVTVAIYFYPGVVIVDIYHHLAYTVLSTWHANVLLLKEKKGNQVSSGIGMTKPVESGVARFESQHHRAPNHQALPLVECWYDLLTWWILIRNFQKLRMERTRMETNMNPWKRKFHRCFFGSHHMFILEVIIFTSGTNLNLMQVHCKSSMATSWTPVSSKSSFVSLNWFLCPGGSWLQGLCHNI